MQQLTAVIKFGILMMLFLLIVNEVAYVFCCATES